MILLKKQNDASFEIHEKNQVINSEILNEVVDVLFKNCHEHIRQGYFEKQFDMVLDKLQLEKPCHGKQMTDYFEVFHVAYDPVADYMD